MCHLKNVQITKQVIKEILETICGSILWLFCQWMAQMYFIPHLPVQFYYE